MENGDVRTKVFYLKSTNNHHFGIRCTMPVRTPPTGVVQLIPGMAEHSGRYQDVANFLAKNGYAVFCADHPGSGLTAKGIEGLGILPSTRGWEIMLENIRSLYTHIRKEYPKTPVFLLGHSMGSILARHFVAVYPVYIQGLILSASFLTPAYRLKLIKPAINLFALFSGPDKKPTWFNHLFYKNFNKYFKNGPTMFEWISSDRKEVDAYVADSYCGYNNSWAFFKTLFRGIDAMKSSQNNLKYRKTMPLLNICGQDDPVGDFGKDAVKIHRHFYKQRFQNNTMKVFRGRHELFHDKQREKVFYYLLDWMNTNLNS